MKKDVLIAVFIGFFIGVVAALGSIKIVQIVKERSDPKLANIKPSATPYPSQELETNTALEITNPKDQSFTDSGKVKIEGKTKNNNTVIIESDNNAEIVEASDNGEFSKEITLLEGGNNIFITSYNNTGEAITKNLNIFYTEEKL